MQNVKQTYKLFLDDMRTPLEAYHYTGLKILASDPWVVVRSYKEFVGYIETAWGKYHAFPSVISFDHDLSYDDQEIWVDVVKFEGIYQVSNLGRVNRISIEKGTSGGILTPDKQESGLYVTLRNKGNDKKYLVHRLVLESFIGTNINKPFVNHKDGNRWNNNISNLEWCTNSENIKHSHDELERVYTAYGENHNNSKTVSKYNKNGVYIDTYGSVNEAGRQENIPFTNIAKNARGERKSAGGFVWKYENKQPTIKTLVEHIKKEDKNYIDRFFIPKLKEKTGFKCAEWLVDFCMDKDIKLCSYFCHSMNPVGRENIINLLNNFKKHQNN